MPKLVSSDAGAVLLGRLIRPLIWWIGLCFRDRGRRDLIGHAVASLGRQPVLGIALGYENLNHHDELRHQLQPIHGTRLSLRPFRPSRLAPAAEDWVDPLDDAMDEIESKSGVISDESLL